jgi:hypothetical protein
MFRSLSLSKLVSKSIPKPGNIQNRRFTTEYFEMTGMSPNELIGLASLTGSLASAGWLSTRDQRYRYFKKSFPVTFSDFIRD